MTFSINADTKQKRESERVEFLKAFVIAQAQVTPFKHGSWALHGVALVDAGIAAWNAIEKTRESK
jgi:hypothetical protein